MIIFIIKRQFVCQITIFQTINSINCNAIQDKIMPLDLVQLITKQITKQQVAKFLINHL